MTRKILNLKREKAPAIEFSLSRQRVSIQVHNDFLHILQS